MPKIVTPVEHLPKLKARKKVAAYVRVSSGKEAMIHSLAAQADYYSNLINMEHEWLFVGIYSDEAITGTKGERKGFRQLLEDCKDGKVDMIITKSISRFARNTVTLLETVRSLKLLGVDVFFEEQNIHTMSADGELMLTILASYAQEESRSVSENMKWRIKKNFEEGMPWNGGMLGYRIGDGQYVVIAEESDVVKRIYAEFLEGKGTNAIAQGLNEDMVPTRYGERWHPSVIAKILRNYTYTGNLLLQKTFVENHITKKNKINQGELPQYHVEDAHEAIIDMDTFSRVQEEMERRTKKYGHAPKSPKRYPFTGLLVCGNCGKSYRRKVTATQPVWICATYNTQGKKYCDSKQIPESTLAEVTATVASIEDIEKIVVHNGNRLEYHLVGGAIIEMTWADRSRSESWTDEMREAVRRRKLERSRA